MFTYWIIFAVISALLLIFYFKKRSAVWGGLTVGLVLGLIIVVYFALSGNRFDWAIIGKWAVIGTIGGGLAELLGKASDDIKKRQQHK
ncbi:MAG TPA: hypothetical protein DCX45_12740 [Acinetobacter junii]|nr:hypothetical protein [Acinetobacter junii]